MRTTKLSLRQFNALVNSTWSHGCMCPCDTCKILRGNVIIEKRPPKVAVEEVFFVIDDPEAP